MAIEYKKPDLGGDSMPSALCPNYRRFGFVYVEGA